MLEFYNDVYTLETKKGFLNSIHLSQYPPRCWERVFEKSYGFENIRQKDLYAFTVSEILEFYKFLDIGTITPLIVYNTNLLKYAQWALNENLISDGQNHFDELNNESLYTCINKSKTNASILSHEQFMELIHTKIKNDQDKYVFFCLYEGVKGKDYQEIIDLRLADIDEKNSVAHLSSGREVYVSQDFINICKEADKQREYVTLGSDMRIFPLIPGENIFKEKHNSRGSALNRSVYNTIIRNISAIYQLSDVITAKSIMDSGLIYYLKRRAEKLDISVTDLIYNVENWKDIAEKYRFNQTTKKRWMLQYSDIFK